jgi:HD-like signal output (HDOD) protein
MNTSKTSGSTIDLRQAVKNLDALPAMPGIAQKLLPLKLDTSEGEQQMLLLIEQDPQISAKIIGLANSPVLGVSHKVTTIKGAALVLGMTRVQSVATGIAIMSLLTNIPPGKFQAQDMWMHSFGIAFAMLGIARCMPQDKLPQEDQIFLAGMLHDIGYLVLAFLDPKQSNALHSRIAAEPGHPAPEVEQELLGITHCELGALLAKHWGLPDEITSVLRYHHAPDAAGSEAGQPLVRMVNIAEKLLPSFGMDEHVNTAIRDEDWQALGIDPARSAEVAEQVAEQAEQAAQFTSSFI